jgi:class 3 adenylate cyclase
VEEKCTLLNKVFTSFDNIILKFAGIEKIKTISSKALLMATVASRNQTPRTAVEVVNSFVISLLREYQGLSLNVNHAGTSLASKDIDVQLKIGVSYGPVVAGVNSILHIANTDIVLLLIIYIRYCG